MADHDASILPPPSAEQRRAAAGQYERANQVIATGNYDYGIQLLLNCCQLDPGNLIYRHTLRQTEKAKYKNNMRGSRLAALTTYPAKARVKAAKRAHDYLNVLAYGEQVLVRNPWDTGTQLDMAAAAQSLDLLDLAVWLLEQARQKNPKDLTVNKNLARLYERRGNFGQAMALWELIRTTAPRDMEARDKAKDIAANATIARGRYQDVVAAPQQKDEPDAEEPGEEVDELAEAGSSPAVDRHAQEVTRLRAQIEKEPTSAPAYLNLAMLYRRAGQLDEARKVLEEGVAPTGRHFDLTTELAELDIEPFRQNLAIIEEKLRGQGANEDLRAMRIRLLKEINTRELDLFRQKADHYPTEKSYRFEMGVRLLRAGQVDEAIRELQALRNDPRHQWRVLLYLGYGFKARSNWRLAERNFEEALQHLPAGETNSRKEILFQLAQGAAKVGDLPKAVELGFELANLDFGYHDIGRLLDEWQNQLHKADVPSD
jgi:tetratricopeptide (TPR) repeat protein